jgi:hypothetical protein
MDGPKTANNMANSIQLNIDTIWHRLRLHWKLGYSKRNFLHCERLLNMANKNAVYTISYTPQAVVSSSTTQYLLSGVSGNTTATSITFTAPKTVTATYSTQYCLTVASQYDSPSPTSRWHYYNTSITAFISSPDSGYLCSGWTGIGSV